MGRGGEMNKANLNIKTYKIKKVISKVCSFCKFMHSQEDDEGWCEILDDDGVHYKINRKIICVSQTTCDGWEKCQ